MRFLFTMNMPPGSGNNLVHQVIADHESESPRELCEAMNDEPFIVVRQFYLETDYSTGEHTWKDRGEVVLNTAHIGKVSVHYLPQRIGPRLHR